ncbi:MAG: hypothetical protein AAGJ83_15340 [Planctomycetota bacterium]
MRFQLSGMTGSACSLILAVHPVRRFSLIATILIGGALFSLPFRRPLPVETPAEQPSGKPKGLDEASIEMLVREVTRDVEVPVFFDPSATQDVIPFAKPNLETQLPLTYEDAAIPLAEDPVYERRFNATVSAPLPTEPRVRATRSSEELAALERRFDAKPVSKPLIDPARRNLGQETLGSLPPKPVVGRAQPRNLVDMGPATRPSSERITTEFGSSFQRQAIETSARREGAARDANRSFGDGRSTSSVLSDLPAPDLSTKPDDASRVKHWIRQPD